MPWSQFDILVDNIGRGQTLGGLKPLEGGNWRLATLAHYKKKPALNFSTGFL